MTRRPDRQRRGSWSVVAVSALAIGLGAGPGFLLGFVAPAVQSELGISRGALGLLIGMFFGACGLTSLFAARVGATLGARTCIMLDLALVAVTMAVTATRISYPLLAVVAVTGGAGYAFGNVGTNLAVTAVAGQGATGLALTLKTGGVPAVASLLALGSGLIATGGWQRLAWALAGASAVAAGLVAAVVPRVSGGAGAPLREPALQHGFWVLPVAAFLFIAGSQPLLSWTVTYLHGPIGLSTVQAGSLISAATLVGLAAMPVVAAVADRVGRGRRAAFVAAICLAAGVGVLTILAGSRWGVALTVAGVVLGIGSNLAGAGLTHAVVVDRAPAAVGRASGVTMAGYYLGAMVAPWVFGVIADASGGYVLPWTICAVLLALAALAYWRAHRTMPVAHIPPPPNGWMPQSSRSRRRALRDSVGIKSPTSDTA